MIAFPFLLAGPAQEVGIQVPEELPDDLDKIKDSYPKFFVYCVMQCGRAMPSADSHWDNAKVVAEFTDEEIKSVTPNQLYERGFV